MKKLFSMIALLLAAAMLAGAVPAAADGSERYEPDDPGLEEMPSSDPGPCVRGELLFELDVSAPGVTETELCRIYVEDPETLRNSGSYSHLVKIGHVSELSGLLGITFPFTRAELLNAKRNGDGKLIPDEAGRNNTCFFVKLGDVADEDAITELRRSPYVKYADRNYLYSVDRPAAPASATETSVFDDVAETAWYRGNVGYVVRTGLMIGTSKNSFEPEGKLTRAMTVTAIYRFAGLPEAADGGRRFLDVPDGVWYSEPVKWASADGVVKGVSATSFDPDGLITRADFATMLFRYGVSVGHEWIGEDAASAGPSDPEKIPDYAAEAVNALYRAGIIKGRPGGAFDPDATITRAEAAAMTERADRSFIAAENDRVRAGGSADRCAYVSGADRFYAAHSASDVAEILSERKAELSARGAVSADRLNSYGDGFFAGNTLAVAFISVSSGSVSFKFDGVGKTDEGYAVELTRDYPSVGTCDMATWCIIAEIPEADVPLSRFGFYSRTGKTRIRIGAGLTDSLGIDFHVSAWIDNMPSTDEAGWKKNVVVRVERTKKTGEPIGDIAVSMAAGLKIFDLVRDPGDAPDECTFRPTEEDLGTIAFTKSGSSYAPFRGKLTFSFGGFGETVSFSVPVSLTY